MSGKVKRWKRKHDGSLKGTEHTPTQFSILMHMR
jgi:hypothetical protein